MRKSFYKGLENDQLEAILRWSSLESRWVWLRSIVALFFLVSFIVALYEASTLWAIVGLLGVVAFGISVAKHLGVRRKLAFHRALLQEVKREQDYLAGNFEGLHPDDEFKNEHHPYLHDLDIFGDRSLFQRIDRSITAEGRKQLATALAELDWADVPSKQEAIAHLAEQTESCLAFRAKGKGMKDMEARNAIQHWLHQPASRPWWENAAFRWLASSLFPACVATVALSGSWHMADLLVYPFLFNLALFGASLKSVKASYGAADKVQHEIRTYEALILHLQTMNLDVEALVQIRSTLFDARQGAAHGLKSLAWTLSQLDSMGNLIGAAVMNGCFMYHLHIASRLSDWKRKFGTSLPAWLDAVNEMEYWVSLAQFHFNHPTYNFPTVTDGKVFEAVNIGHPFIDASKRVDNDLHFDGYHWVVLTGSNMAGKSTFLRSLGLSIILSANGLPVCAERLTLSPFQLLSSMKPQDSVNDDRSYFQAEVLRLKMIIDRMNAQAPSFLLFDEILRGTNSQDKRNGTMHFLERIRASDALGVIATHDVEITEIAQLHPNRFRNLYFESKSVEGSLVFDYVLRPGVCSTPNATELLKKHGII